MYHAFTLSNYSRLTTHDSRYLSVRHCEETDCVDEAVYACVYAKSMDCHTPLTVVLAMMTGHIMSREL